MPGILPEPSRRAQNRFTAERKGVGPATPVCGERKSPASAQPVGARLPANAVCQATLMAQADRLRGQARSYIGSAATARLWASATPVCGERNGAGTRKTCRSALARERGGSGEMVGTGRPPSRASSLLQWIGVGREFGVMQRTCGSRLAGECGGSGDIDGTGRPPSRASALLH